MKAAKQLLILDQHPALSLDFTSSLDPRITFTRASAGTDLGPTAPVLYSSNQPRFDTSGLGLLVEEARTNLLLNSLIDGSSLSTQTVTVASGTTYALSFYGTGSIVNTGANTATLSGTGAYPSRAVLVFTAGTTSLTCTVSGTVQYAQLEATSASWAGPTSFIPTAGTSVARSADVASMTGTNFSSWYNQNAGTFILKASPSGNYNQEAYIVQAYLDGNNRIQIGRASSSTWAAAGKRWIGGPRTAGTPGYIATGSDDSGGASKTALAFANGDYAFAKDGSIVGTLSSPATIPTGLTTLYIGSFTGTAIWFNGHIASIQYYGRRLSNAKLQARTS